jgi:integrase
MQRNKSLQALAEEFISYKQDIGYIYETQEKYLVNYVMYAEKHSPGISLPNKVTIVNFIDTLSHSPGSQYNATAALREFGKYLSRRGYTDTYIIPAKSNPAFIPEPPYFFTAEEIKHFFEACDSILPHKSFPGRERVFPVLFRLLYCCGLRCKEARMLLHENVHPDDCFLDIIQSKGPKSRRIYISNELSMYLQSYEASICLLYPRRKYFFPSRKDTCYGCDVINANFRRFWMKAFPDFTISSRPRAYDFRHHFVWANLNRWARDGIDLNVMLPYLMRYMGHQQIKSTLYYFRFVPDFFPVFADLSKPLESILPEVPYEEG